jgi:ABC-type sugar transport system substrate-binding protein
MKKRVLWLLRLLFLLLLVAAALVAQNPNYNNGPVWRVIYVDVKPGMGDAFWTDIRQNFKPIYDEFKKQGCIVDYCGL